MNTINELNSYFYGYTKALNVYIYIYLVKCVNIPPCWKILSLCTESILKPWCRPSPEGKWGSTDELVDVTWGIHGQPCRLKQHLGVTTVHYPHHLCSEQMVRRKEMRWTKLNRSEETKRVCKFIYIWIRNIWLNVMT